MIVLANVYIDVLRSSYTSTGGTDPATPYLSKVEGHITRIKDAPLVPFPASALRAEYEVYVDTDVDIQRGDIVTNVRRKDNDELWFQGKDTELWRVLDANNSSPGFLEYRDVVLGRFVAGGPIQ